MATRKMKRGLSLFISTSSPSPVFLVSVTAVIIPVAVLLVLDPVLVETLVVGMILRLDFIAAMCAAVGVPAVSVAVGDHAGRSGLSKNNRPKVPRAAEAATGALMPEAACG